MKYLQLVSAIESASQHLLARAAATVNQALVVRNWVVGAYVVEFEQRGDDRAKYGEGLLARLSADLQQRDLKGLSADMLERMRQFYLVYPQFGSNISAPVVRKLGCRLPVDMAKKSAPLVRKSPRTLVLSPDLILRFSWSQIIELIRDPYVLEFTGLAPRPEYTESELETALLDNLQAFLLEIGTGFCFEARQFRVTLGNEHDFVDLVFYHRHLRCHVLLDLKVRAFKHADAGQMNYYLNYFKKHMRGDGDHPPVGILLCSDKDQTKVEFATAGMDNKLFVSRYLLALPSMEQLRRFVETDRSRFEAEHTRSRKSK